ncbi:hypothetical protein RJT34_00323 [Clitoria ternatea]|uniref:Uncharacterized protein n=1 Tax=Clitoria ternatea TaxID=43366 RepID=A0AAN9Q0L6_CLITE
MIPNFLTARSTSSFTHHKSTQFQLGSLLQHKYNNNAFLFSLNPFTSSTSSGSESEGNHPKGDTFTVSYLINSCGLSPESAKKISKKMILKNPETSNAVIALLRHYGFSKTHVARLVEKQPSLLAANAEKTLLPKLKFFQSIGVSNVDMPKILVANYLILLRSLKKCLIPRYEIIRSVVRDDHEVVRALRNAPRAFIYCDIMKFLVPNVKVLSQCGVPQSSISLLMVHFPSVLYLNHSRFMEAVKTVAEIGCDPLKTSFVLAVQVLATTSKVAWESKLEVYEKWGWSRDMALRAFRKFPNFMKLSEETIAKKLSILVNDMGFSSSEEIAEFPQILTYNLEKRVIPRISVVKVLISKGLLRRSLHFTSYMCSPEEIFLEKFVVRFQDDLPFLPDVYKGVVNYKNVI